MEREREREREREEAEEVSRARRRDARIAQANRNISVRPEQPPHRSSAEYRRPTVEIPSHGAGLGLGSEEEIVGRMRGLHMDGMDDDDEEEEEARKQRLRDRMMPKRRSTIGAASRRTRVQYPDGMYQLE